MDASSPVLREIATESEAPPRVAPKRKAWKGAEILVEYLIKEKVPYLFGVCGHGNIGFLDAAADAAPASRRSRCITSRRRATWPMPTTRSAMSRWRPTPRADRDRAIFRSRSRGP